MVPTVTPQLLGNVGLRALRNAAAEPQRWAIEPKVDGVRGLVVFDGGRIETRIRQGVARDWLRGDAFEAGLRRLADRLPILWHGTVLDGELTAGQFAGTMAALHGSKRFRPHLRYFAFDVPFEGSHPRVRRLYGYPYEPTVRMRALASNDGYYLLGLNGTVWAFGAARYFGSMAGTWAVDLMQAP